MNSADGRGPIPEQAYRKLAAAGAAYRETAGALEEAQRIRDAAIIVSSELGMSRRKVASAAMITVGRVQQVLAATSRGARFDLADHLLDIAVKRLPPKERDRYARKWEAELTKAGREPLARLSFVLSLLLQ